MKHLGAVRFPDSILDIPDHTIFMALSTAGAAIDLPSGAQWIRITSLSTAASPLPINPFLSMGTTAAAVPTSGLSTLASSAYVRTTNERIYPVGGSTQLSLICQDSSGWASIEIWA